MTLTKHFNNQKKFFYTPGFDASNHFGVGHPRRLRSEVRSCFHTIRLLEFWPKNPINKPRHTGICTNFFRQGCDRKEQHVFVHQW